MNVALNLRENWRIYTELDCEVKTMKVVPYSDDWQKYLILDNVIDYNDEEIKKVSDALFEQAENDLAYIKVAYEFVRDQIFEHTACLYLQFLPESVYIILYPVCSQHWNSLL